MSSLRVLLLDYIILAVYPMMLVILTCYLLRFLGRFNLTVLLCRPLRECYRKEWNIKASTFATMLTLLLSYVKILNVTMTIITPYYVHYMDGSRGLAYFSAATDKKYASKSHATYFIIASVMGFILPILLLCLYPCRWFQRCLNRTQLRLQALHTSMDVLQGHYRTEPNDLRCFSGCFLVAQSSDLIIHSIIGLFQYLLIFIVSLAVARPFKNKWHNIINTALFTALLVTNLSIAFQFESDVMGILSQEIIFSVIFIILC